MDAARKVAKGQHRLGRVGVWSRNAKDRLPSIKLLKEKIGRMKCEKEGTESMNVRELVQNLSSLSGDTPVFVNAADFSGGDTHAPLDDIQVGQGKVLLGATAKMCGTKSEEHPND